MILGRICFIIGLAWAAKHRPPLPASEMPGVRRVLSSPSSGPPASSSPDYNYYDGYDGPSEYDERDVSTFLFGPQEPEPTSTEFPARDYGSEDYGGYDVSGDDDYVDRPPPPPKRKPKRAEPSRAFVPKEDAPVVRLFDKEPEETKKPKESNKPNEDPLKFLPKHFPSADSPEEPEERGHFRTELEKRKAEQIKEKTTTLREEPNQGHCAFVSCDFEQGHLCNWLDSSSSFFIALELRGAETIVHPDSGRRMLAAALSPQSSASISLRSPENLRFIFRHVATRPGLEIRGCCEDECSYFAESLEEGAGPEWQQGVLACGPGQLVQLICENGGDVPSVCAFDRISIRGKYAFDVCE